MMQESTAQDFQNPLADWFPLSSRHWQTVHTHHLGLKPLSQVIILMQRLAALRAEDEIPDTVLTAFHPPVYTLGRGNQLQKSKTLIAPLDLDQYQQRLPHPVLPIQRGGGITFHDPGQIMIYPILKLNPRQGRTLSSYIRQLEQSVCRIIQILNPSCRPYTRENMTGVWLEEKKVASIGVGVQKWVTLHGVALNLRTDLSCFRQINPCGMEANVMGNIESFLPANCDVYDILSRVHQVFEQDLIQKQEVEI